MKSLDTNILVYAANRAAQEHENAAAIWRQLVDAPAQWILADQVLWEFYRALRNPAILARPLGASEAMARVRFLRHESGARHCGYDVSIFDAIAKTLERPTTPGRGTFDVILAVTLIRNGVTEFYTRNTKHFEDAGFARVINPID